MFLTFQPSDWISHCIPEKKQETPKTRTFIAIALAISTVALGIFLLIQEVYIAAAACFSLALFALSYSIMQRWQKS